MSEWRNFLTYLPLDQANWEFKSSTNLIAPMLLYYSGFLGATPNYRHCLIVTQLEGSSFDARLGQTIPRADRLNKSATHDFSMTYQSLSENASRELLFRFQIQGTDITAKQLTYLLVETLQHTPQKHQFYLLDQSRCGFWAGLAANKLYQLKTNNEVWLDEQPLL